MAAVQDYPFLWKFKDRSMTTTGLPQKAIQNKIFNLKTKYLANDATTVHQNITDHIEYTLACTRYNFDHFSAYQATARSVRDRMLEKWNDTQQFWTETDPKRIYYLSLEFLMGRSLQNSMFNLGITGDFSKALYDLGFRLEEIYEEEKDAALGNGGLGRLAACFMDSIATLNYPGWGYGLRYNYGMFEQGIWDGFQTEMPDYWLSYGNPWEIERLDVRYLVRFYGDVHSSTDADGKLKWKWENGEVVEAVAYDNPVPGYRTFNQANIRLWSSRPHKVFDLQAFNKGDYYSAVEQKQNSENITSVLYPNDSTHEGKVLRLKQQHFFCAATLADVIRRFLKLHNSFAQFPKKVAIQLNDTHPTIAIVELMRLLMDIHGLGWDESFDICVQTFAYTNHTVLPEALEVWPVSLMESLLPRHMLIIYEINRRFLELVQKKWPDDVFAHMEQLSIIQEGPSKKIRMAHLAIVGSHCVNGVAAMHTDLVKHAVFSGFYALWPEKFQNKTNGVTPRRWVAQCNRPLSKILTTWLKTDTWVTNLSLLSKLSEFADNAELQQQWRIMKDQNKDRLAAYVTKFCGVSINTHALFDVHVKRIHEYKRQLLNILSVIHRYRLIKSMSPDERKNVVPRVVFFAGKAAAAYFMAKLIIKLINNVAATLNADADTKDLLQVVFIPNYNVSLAEIIIPGSDINQQISTAGTEASGTSNMKFMANGSLIIGTMDGANVEIAEEMGENNMFVFGLRSAAAVDKARKKMAAGKVHPDERLQTVFDMLRSGAFGDADLFSPIIDAVVNSDTYIIMQDWDSYLEAQERVDKAYRDEKNWLRSSIISCSCSGKFSSDRTIQQYAHEIWNVTPAELPPSEYRWRNRPTDDAPAVIDHLLSAQQRTSAARASADHIGSLRDVDASPIDDKKKLKKKP